MGELSGLRVCLANRGALAARLGKSNLALVSLREEEEIAGQVLDLAGLQDCLGRQAAVLMARRRLDDAIDRLDRREALCRDRLDDDRGLVEVCLQRAELFGVVMKQTRLGLHHVEEARALAMAHGRDDLLPAIEAARSRVLAAPLRGPM